MQQTFGNHGKTIKDGGAKGIRTPDLLNAIQTLYQLSYDPIRSGTRTVETQQVFVKNYLGKFGLVSMESPAIVASGFTVITCAG